MPRKPKLSFSHTQGQGSEFYFKDIIGNIISMIDPTGGYHGVKGAGQKSKQGTWSILRPLQWRRK